MASDNKHPSAVPVDLLCFRCNGHLTVEKVIGTSFQNTQPNSSSQELENLQEDMLELNKVLNVQATVSYSGKLFAHHSTTIMHQPYNTQA
jgi:hypothetical protein